LGSCVDPFRWTLNFGNVSNWGLIEHDVTSFVAPLGTKLFVAERRYQSDSSKDCGQRLAVVNLGFSLHSCFVLASTTLGFVSDLPCLPVSPDPEQFTSCAQSAVKCVIQGIHLVSARSN